MATFIGFHEVDDVDAWLNSPALGQLVGSFEGASARKSVDPTGTNTTGVIIEIPDQLVPELMEKMQSAETREGEESGGVQRDAIVMLVEA